MLTSATRKDLEEIFALNIMILRVSKVLYLLFFTLLKGLCSSRYLSLLSFCICVASRIYFLLEASSVIEAKIPTEAYGEFYTF